MTVMPSVANLITSGIRQALGIVLRPYQADLRRRIDAYWAANPDHNICMVLPTGGGKTAIVSDVVLNHRGFSLCIAHRNELVSQLSMALARSGIRHRILADEKIVRAIIKQQIEKFGTHYHYAAADAGVAGVMTLLGKRVQKEHGAWLAEVTLAIPDESHHVLRDNTWGKALALTPKARVLGPTAWPGRSDGKGIGRHAHGVFDVIIAGPPMGDLIRMGYLTPFRVFCPQSDFHREDLGVSKSTGEFTAASSSAAVSKSTITGDAVKHYHRLISGKTAFVFTTDVKNAGVVADKFNADGVRAAVLDGETDVGIRIKTMAAFERREYKVIANVALFGEGTDIPNLDASIMADPTQSYCKFLQEAGRAARLSIAPTIAAHWDSYTDEQRRSFIAASDKPFGYLIDMVGNVKQHGLPGARTDYSLDDRERSGKNKPADVMPTKMCAKCTAEYEAVHRACPYCAEVAVPAQRSGPQFVDGDLFELDLSALQGLEKAVNEANDAPAIPYGATPAMVQSSRNKHYEKLRTRAAFKELRDVWAGWRQAEGDTASMAMRRFFFTFGVDVRTAETLNRADTQVLLDKIRTVLTKSSVRSSVPLVHNEEL